MKQKKFLLALVGLLFGSIAFAQNYKPVLINFEPENIFIPQDFDNNDNAQVVVDGTFPDTCYKVGPVEYTVNQDKKVIYVRNKAYHYNSSWCATLMVPFFQTVNLGILREGKYEVKVVQNSGATKTSGLLPVFYSKNIGPDDFLYAPVTEVFLKNKITEGNRSIVMRGYYTNTCMYMKDVKILYRTGNVIEILPIANLRNDIPCYEKIIPYEKEIEVTEKIKGKALLHVRSLSGQAVNNVVNFDI
jgi:hypothetical protein